MQHFFLEFIYFFAGIGFGIGGFFPGIGFAGCFFLAAVVAALAAADAADAPVVARPSIRFPPTENPSLIIFTPGLTPPAHEKNVFTLINQYNKTQSRISSTRNL